MQKREPCRLTWKDLETYARAWLEGRIPEELIADSIVTYERLSLFGTQCIPLPRYDRFREVLGKAAPRMPWWKRIFRRTHAKTK